MKANPELFEVPYISSLQDMIIKSCSVYKNKLALEDYIDHPISKVSYSELYDYLISFGKALTAAGVNQREHIAIIGENRVQWGIAYLTAMMFNYVIVPIDKALKENEIINIIHESDAKVVIFSETYHSIISDMKHSLHKVKKYISMDEKVKRDDVLSMVEMINSQSASINKLPEINPDECAEIIYTSGSLGRAKGVMLSQKNIASNLMGMRKMVKIFASDRFIAILPMHHTYQCTCGFLCPVYSGASVHFARSLKTIMDDVQKSKATLLLGAPLLFNKMYQKIMKTISENKIKSILIPSLIGLSNLLPGMKKIFFKELHEKFGGSMRLLIAGGAPPDPKVSKGFRDFGFSFIQGYGLTETSPILTLNRIDFYKDESAGLPLPDVQIKISEPDNRGIGEVLAKGENVMHGYYKNNQLTDESFEDGWFKTGDLGFIDDDGFLHLRGRKKNVIIANNGENVFPEEIEDILNRSDFILESVVYGERDEKHDEIIAARIVINSEEFIEHATKNSIEITGDVINKIISDEVRDTNRKLPAYKQIRKFYITDKEFEKTTTQKIKRHLLHFDHPTSEDQD